MYEVKVLDIDGDITALSYTISTADPSRSVLTIGSRSGIITTTKNLRDVARRVTKYWVTGKYACHWTMLWMGNAAIVVIVNCYRFVG